MCFGLTKRQPAPEFFAGANNPAVLPGQPTPDFSTAPSTRRVPTTFGKFLKGFSGGGGFEGLNQPPRQSPQSQMEIMNDSIDLGSPLMQSILAKMLSEQDYQSVVPYVSGGADSRHTADVRRS